MSIQFTDPHLNLLTNNSLKKTDGRTGSSSEIGRNDNSSPLESPYYAISQQARRELQPVQPQTSNTPSLSTLLQTAQSEIRKISKQIGALKDLASRAADTSQTDAARNFFQKDFYGTLGKINDSAELMNWNGMTLSEGNTQYKINQVNLQSLDENNSAPKIQDLNNVSNVSAAHSEFTKPVDLTDKIPGAIATDEVTFSGNLNANEPIITAIDSYTTVGYVRNVVEGQLTRLTLSDGSRITVNSGRYTIGNSIPQSNTIQVYDSQGMAHNVPIQLEKTSANTWVASLSSLTTAGTYPTTNIQPDDTYIARHDSNSYYSYIKESDGTFTRVSFIDTEDDNALTTSFKISFDSSGNPIGNLSGALRLEYNFDAYPSEDNPRMFVQRPGGLFTYTDSMGNTYVTTNTYRPAGYPKDIRSLKNIEFLSRYISGSYTFPSAVNGATVTEPIANFSGLTQYVGQNTASASSNGITADERNINTQPAQLNQPIQPAQLTPLSNFYRPAQNNFPMNGPGFFMPHGPRSMSHQVPNNMPQQQNSSTVVININLIDMHPRSLGTGNLISPQGRFLNPFDQQRYDSFSGNFSSQNDWMEIVMGAANKNLNSINILSQRNASIALRVLEGALDQVQRELSNVNNYIQRFITSSGNAQQTNNVTNNSYNNRAFRDNFV